MFAGGMRSRRVLVPHLNRQNCSERAHRTCTQQERVAVHLSADKCGDALNHTSSRNACYPAVEGRLGLVTGGSTVVTNDKAVVKHRCTSARVTQRNTCVPLCVRCSGKKYTLV